MIASPSYNRAYLASCLRHSAQIPRFARNFRYAQPLGAMPCQNIKGQVIDIGFNEDAYEH